MRNLEELQKHGKRILRDSDSDLTYEELQALYRQAEQTPGTVTTIINAFRIGVAVGRGCQL